MTIEQQIDALGSKLSFKPAGKNSEAAMRLERNMQYFMDLKGKHMALQRKKQFLELLGSSSISLETADHDFQPLESRAKELELAWQSNVDEIQRMNKQVDSVFDNITSDRPRLKSDLRDMKLAQQQIERMKAETKTMVEVEKVFEMRPVSELEPVVHELSQTRLEMEQKNRQLVASRDALKTDVQALQHDMNTMTRSLVEIREKAKEGKESIEQRLKKQHAIREWYHNASRILGKMLGVQLHMDSDASILKVLFETQIEAQIKMSGDFSIEEFQWNCDYPYADLLEQARQSNDVCWFIRQLHVRGQTFQRRLDELTSLGQLYLVDYNVKKQPDVLLVQAMDKIFAFQMSHEYPMILQSGSAFQLASYQPSTSDAETNIKKLVNSGRFTCISDFLDYALSI